MPYLSSVHPHIFGVSACSANIIFYPRYRNKDTNLRTASQWMTRPVLGPWRVEKVIPQAPGAPSSANLEAQLKKKPRSLNTNLLCLSHALARTLNLSLRPPQARFRQVVPKTVRLSLRVSGFTARLVSSDDCLLQHHTTRTWPEGRILTPARSDTYVRISSTIWNPLIFHRSKYRPQHVNPIYPLNQDRVASVQFSFTVSTN